MRALFLRVPVFVFGLLVTVAPLRAADSLPDLAALKGGEVTLATVAALVVLDENGSDAGYGLCAAAGEMLCARDGSVGYGLCRIAGAQLCKENGSVGYGLCMLADGFNCRVNGSVGYGLCRLAGQKNC